MGFSLDSERIARLAAQSEAREREKGGIHAAQEDMRVKISKTTKAISKKIQQV